MRGSNTLFADIFDDQPLVKQRKGRSSTLIAQRNELLIDRYFYYGKFCDKRYTKILEILSSEFFISEVTIPELISENDSFLHQLKKQQPPVTHFKKKWPHLVW